MGVLMNAAADGYVDDASDALQTSPVYVSSEVDGASALQGALIAQVGDDSIGIAVFSDNAALEASGPEIVTQLAETTGYDTIMLMAQAVEIAGSTDGDAVADALTSNEFDLLTGKLSYRSAEEGHAPDKAAVLIALDQGKPSFIGWRQPKNPPAP